MEDVILKQIKDKLSQIEEQEQVMILYAAESGSRAWGIASPDSDYDVRFIYVRKPEVYLRLDPPKDVIEWQLDEVLDINGWDLKKALVQFQRGNATLFEWAMSPIVYHTSEIWMKVYEAAKPYFSKKSAVYHYYGTASKSFLQELQGEKVKYKKYFYALRPLLAANYIEGHNEPAPVLFDELMKQELPEALRRNIEQVLKIKQISDEAEYHPRNHVVQDYIRNEIQRQKTLADQMPDDRNYDWEALNTVFLNVLSGIPDFSRTC